jgi:hypothetical protein
VDSVFEYSFKCFWFSPSCPPDVVASLASLSYDFIKGMSLRFRVRFGDTG